MKIILNGYKSKMGKIVYDYLCNKGYEIEGFDLEHPISKDVEFDIAIDFSSLSGAISLFNICIEKKKPLVIGTTGFSPVIIEEIKNKALEAKIPVYLISNFSLSMCGVFSVLKRLSSLFENVKIEETHHLSRKDFPSGTTLKLLSVCDPSLRKEIKIKRINDFVFIHEITLSSKYEELVIKHKIKNKICYAIGVEQAIHHLDFVGVKEEL